MTIALVTGTSSGIGLATAVTLARGGHTVIATMRNLESAGAIQKVVADGEKIREIVDGDSWQLRYPVGPDAVPFLKWRASKTDEEVVNLGGASDEEFKLLAKNEFGLDVNV